MNKPETLTDKGSQLFNNKDSSINQQKLLESEDIFGNKVNGLEAIALHLTALNVPGNQLWVKISHNQIYCCEKLEGEGFTVDTPIYNSVGDLDDRRKGGKCLGKLGEFILKKSHSEDGGVFLNFGYPQGGFTKLFLIGATDIGFEPDDLPLEVQKTRYIDFQKVTGLKPTFLSSGGKSVHGHITTSELLTKEQGLYLRRLGAIAFLGDPCIANNLCQPMRLAGAFRKDKGRYQSLYQVGEKYSYQEIVEGFRKWFEYVGFPFADSIPDNWWGNFSRILRTDPQKPSKKNDDGTLNIEAFNRDWGLLKAELESGLEGFENEKLARKLEQAKRQQEQEKKRLAYGSINGGVSLIDCVNQANDRLGDSAFNIEKQGRKTGYYERCNCPFHNSNSGNSAMIAESNGRYRFWCRQCTPGEVIDGFLFNYCLDNGLDPTYRNYPKGKDWVEYAKIYCEKAGVSIPENDYKPRANLNKKQKKHWDFLSFFNNLKTRFKPKGFGIPKNDAIEYEKGDRLKFFEDNPGVILDNSGTGSGKSHDVANIELKPGERLIYIYNDHRNPTVEAIADFPDLIPRNVYGFYWKGEGDNKKLKKATAKTADKATIKEGYCPRADLFPILTEKGYDPNGKNGGQSEICKKCPYLQTCQFTQGWFLHDRREVLEKLENSENPNDRRIRAHIDSLWRDFDYSKTTIVFDESSQIFKGTKVIRASVAQLYADLERVQELINDDESNLLNTILRKLNPLFKDDSRYGLDHAAIVEVLAGFDSNLDDLITKIDALPLPLDKAIPEAKNTGFSELTKAEKKQYWDLIGSTKERENKELQEETKENLDKIPPNSLSNILKVVKKDKGIVLSICKGTLSITIDNRASYEFLKGAKNLINLDATQSIEDLKLQTGLESPITAGKEKVTPTNNLTVIQIKVKGLASKNISQTAINRVNAILETLPEMARIGHKKWKEADLFNLSGYWFNHSRGSNDYEGNINLCFIGLPNPHWGQLQNEYLALKGDLEGFDEYYQRKKNEEILQGIGGRQRANREPDKQFTAYVITSDNPQDDLNWLSEFGIKVNQSSGFEFTPDGGTEGETTWQKITEAALHLIQNGLKQTETAIAEIIGKTQQAVNKAIRGKGLTARLLFQKIQETLNTTNSYKDSNRNGCKDHTLYRELRNLYSDNPLYFGADAIQAILEKGLEYFWDEYLSFFPRATQAKICTQLLAFFDEDEVKELMAIT